MNFKIFFKINLLVCSVFLSASPSGLAKRANVEEASSPMGSDFSYQSQYASRSDGSVNILTGAASCNMKLYSISTKSGLKYDVNLTYNGSVQGELTKNNTESPTGLVGLGWHFTPETIFRDTKGTTDLTDDKFYYVQQNGSVSELIDLGNSKYQIKGNPYWKVSFVSGYFLIVYPDGTRLEFGSLEHSLHFVQYESNYSDYGDRNVLNYQYDLSTITSPNGGGSITFDYNIHTDSKYKNTTTTIDYDAHHICEYRRKDVQDGTLVGFVFGERRVDGPNCLGTRDVRCLQLNADYYWTNTDLRNTAPTLKNADLSAYYIEQTFTGFIYHFPCCGYDEWTLYLKRINPIVTETFIETGIFVDRSELLSIKSDNNTEISFVPDSKNADEYGISKVGNNDRVIRTIGLSKDGVLQENLLFTYSGEIGQVPHVDVGYGKKRLLTGIRSLSTRVKRIFEYGGNGAFPGLLTKIIDPINGKKTTYVYGLNTINGSDGISRSVDVVHKIIESGGVGSVPDIETAYTYTTNSSEQDFDEGSGIPYWGKVTANSATGSIITKFDLNKTNNKFGTRTSTERYNTTSKLVSSESYTYVVKSFGPSNNLWYEPVLIHTTTVNDGLSIFSGTSECAIDPQNGMASQSWVKNSDGKTLVTKRKYAYEVHTTEMGTSGTNQLSEVASTKLIQFTSYNPLVNPGACDLSTGIVIKATYTVWSKSSAGQWHPSATYAWNSPMDNQGLPTTTFYDFDESQPTAHGWQLTGTIDKYDDFGNVLQASNASGVSNSIIYGTPHYLPTASIANAKYGECYFTSFEEDVPWTVDEGGSIVYATDHAKTGVKSLKISNTTPIETIAYSPWKILDVGLSAAKKYVFSCWVYTTGPQASIFFATSVNGTRYETNHYESIITSATAINKWVFLQKTFEAPAGAKYFQISVGKLTSTTAATDVYFDDVKYYPAAAMMTTTYYDPKWLTPILSVDANENSSPLLVLDNYGRPACTYKINKNLSSSDVTGQTLLSKIEYHHIGQDLRLLTPNGGEDLIPGQQYSIAWSGPSTIGTGIGAGVDLLYYNGTTWNRITDALTLQNQNSFLWNVPTNATGCKIKIWEHGNTANFDESDAVFNIRDYLSITQPAGGEVFWTNKRFSTALSTPYSIRWSTAGGSDSNVRIDYFDGTAWRIIVSNTPNDGSYDWTEIGAGGAVKNASIRISDASTGTFGRRSNLFTIYSNHGYLRRLGF